MGVGKFQGQGRARLSPLRDGGEGGPGSSGRTPLDSRADLFYKPVGHLCA